MWKRWVKATENVNSWPYSEHTKRVYSVNSHPQTSDHAKLPHPVDNEFPIPEVEFKTSILGISDRNSKFK